MQAVTSVRLGPAIRAASTCISSVEHVGRGEAPQGRDIGGIPGGLQAEEAGAGGVENDVAVEPGGHRHGLRAGTAVAGDVAGDVDDVGDDRAPTRPRRTASRDSPKRARWTRHSQMALASAATPLAAATTPPAPTGAPPTPTTAQSAANRPSPVVMPVAV